MIERCLLFELLRFLCFQSKFSEYYLMAARERERVAYLLLGNINRAHNVPESSTVRWWRWQRLHNKLRGHELKATHFMLQKKNQNKFIRFCLSILEFKWQKWNRCVILLSDVQSAKIEKLVKKKITNQLEKTPENTHESRTVESWENFMNDCWL